MRFYLPSTSAAAPISPAKDAAWEADASSGLSRLITNTVKANSAMATQSHADSNQNNQDICFRTYCYGPLAAQSIDAQSIRWTIRAQETNANNNLFLAWLVKVVSSDGSTVRGKVLDLTLDSPEINDAAFQSRSLGATSTQVDAQGGDYLIFEMGVSGDPNATDHDSSLRFGDDAGTDLTQGDTDTDDDNPWVDFANDVVLLGGRATVARGVARGVMRGAR